jgi:Rrf2 family protein
VNISAKTEYACLAVMELAANYGSGEPVRLRSIADQYGIPPRFLVQILLQLKGAGIVASTRGAAGGYTLARDPQHLTLADVMSVIDGQPTPLTANATHETPGCRALLQAWNEVCEVQQQMLSRITLADLVERVRGETESMYFI